MRPESRNPGSFPWVMRRFDGFTALFDCFRKLLVRLGMLDSPSAQKCNQVFTRGIASRYRYDARDRSSRFEESRCLAVQVNALDQFRKAASGIFNRQHIVIHVIQAITLLIVCRDWSIPLRRLQERIRPSRL